jgi:hypothetical protein
VAIPGLKADDLDLATRILGTVQGLGPLAARLAFPS